MGGFSTLALSHSHMRRSADREKTRRLHPCEAGDKVTTAQTDDLSCSCRHGHSQELTCMVSTHSCTKRDVSRHVHNTPLTFRLRGNGAGDLAGTETVHGHCGSGRPSSLRVCQLMLRMKRSDPETTSISKRHFVKVEGGLPHVRLWCTPPFKPQEWVPRTEACRASQVASSGAFSGPRT